LTRKAHQLITTSGALRPSRAIFFDTETSKSVVSDKLYHHKLKLGVALHCRTVGKTYLKPTIEARIDNAQDFWRKATKWTSPKSKTYLIAHNLIFDLVVLDAFNILPALGWELVSFYEKGMVSIFRFKLGDRTLIGLDNGNLFRGALDRWGKLVGRPKIEIDFETCTDQELYDYCRNDVLIMVDSWVLWLDFLDRHKCGSFKVTVASTAFNTWRHRFLPSRVFIHDHKAATDLERASYKGGRTEALYQGSRDNGPFYYVDVNSMYGYVLQKHSYPSAFLGYQEQSSKEILKRRLAKYAVVADVTVEVDANYFPLKRDGHTFYPLGQFDTVLTTGELQLAQDQGWIREVRAMAWYAQQPLFEDYINYFYALRLKYAEEDNPGFKEICKYLIMSLYGKFGQMALDQELIGECDPKEVGSETVYDKGDSLPYRHIFLAGKVFRETRQGESFHSFPAIAAHVTAYARLYMGELLFSLPKHHVFYMDTDSFIVDQTGLSKIEALLDDTVLGKLKIEHESPWLTINAPKDYAMLEVTKTKGISKSAIQLSANRYRQEQWVRLAGMLALGDVSSYLVRTVDKEQRRIIHSGEVLRSGWVKPFMLDE